MTELLPAARQKLATHQLDQWTAEQVGKGAVHDTKNDDAMGDSTQASGSGATEAKRAIGRAEADDRDGFIPEGGAVAPKPETFNIGSPVRGEGFDIEFTGRLAPIQG